MGKEFVDQHVVPKRYLERFASIVNGKYIIGTRYRDKNGVKLFRASTDDVGYIKNFYDVTDKADPKYWEHYFDREIDRLCGTEMESIISYVLMSRNNSIIFSEHSKEVLAKVMIAQMMRVPSSFDYIKGIYPRIEKEVKDEVLSALPASLLKRFGQRVKEIKLDEQWQKEQYFNHSFAPENFNKYCQILKDRIWVAYVNVCRNDMPFATSDNPVLVENVRSKEIGLFHNGIVDSNTYLFYPISPAIAIANYSRNGIMGLLADELDCRMLLIDDMKYIMAKNTKIIDQAHHHSFIPQPLFEELMEKKGSDT